VKTGGSSPVTFFLDANVLISAAWKENAEVAGIWRIEGVRLITSMYVMSEVERNLPLAAQVDRLRRLIASVVVLTLNEAADLVEVLALPTKDQPILAAAIEAKANYLITGDKKHFKQLFGATVGGVRIEPPTNLLAIFRIRKV
jgi:predicted nucleic acid-binding protein